MAARIRRDHEQIRARAGTLATVADANSLGQLLNDHVRFEEREAFELLEKRLDPGLLAELGAEIRAAR